MNQFLSSLRGFFSELKRRNVYKVGATYPVVAFWTLRAARLIFPATTLEGVYDALVLFAVVGFPNAPVLAWAVELTPEGVRQTGEAKEPTEKGALCVIIAPTF